MGDISKGTTRPQRRVARRLIWGRKTSDVLCPACTQPVLYRDPVYAESQEDPNPVHEWCAWKAKQQQQEDKANG